VGGGEKDNIFRIPAGGGPALNLTGTQGVGNWNAQWRGDAKEVAYCSERDQAGLYQVYAVPAEGGASRLLVPAAGGGSIITARWSPDNSKLALLRTHDYLHTGVSVWDVAAGAERVLVPIDEDTHTAFAAWSPDGTRLLVTSNRGNGYDNVAVLDVQTGASDWITQGVWEAEAHDWSREGRHVLYTRNIEGDCEALLYDTETRRERRLPLPPGVFSKLRFSPDGKRVALLFASADRPADIWVYDIAAGTMTQVTYSLVGGIMPERMTPPVRVRYPSFDGTPISSFLYVPPGLAKDGTHPAVVYVHGGPTAQHTNGFRRDIQYLVDRGYLVLAPNYRGSTGFGRAFEEANRLDLGGGDFRDCCAAHDFLRTVGYVDPARIAILGGSYGGYMTLMGLTKAPDRWAAGVAIVPFANWFTEYENEDEVLQAFDRVFMGDPVEHADRWRDRSPFFFVGNIKAPLLLLAGENDIRCPAEETQQMIDAIQENGGVVEAKVYAGEGHGFVKRENSIDAFRRTADFLDRYVKNR
jgi:dipeptidyl aminopeptidase/acylaminoacyl peptidase